MFKKFFKDESGAVTVDWVVLTAGIVTLGLAVGMLISSPTNSLANEISTSVEAMSTVLN